MELILVIIPTCSQVECLQHVGTSPVNFTHCNISCNLFIHPLSSHVSIFSIHLFLGTSLFTSQTDDMLGTTGGLGWKWSLK